MADTVDSQWGLGTLISLWEDVWFPYLERIPLIPSAILEQWKLNPSLDHFTHILIFIGILVIIIGIVITKCFQKVNQNEIITSKVSEDFKLFIGAD